MNEVHTTCPLCRSPKIEQITLSGGRDMYRIICGRCGQFICSDEMLMFAESQLLSQKGYLLSALVRELNETQQPVPELLTTNLSELLQHYLIPREDDIDAKAIKLLHRIKGRTKFYGDRCDLIFDADFPLAYAQNAEELIAILRLLEDTGNVRQSMTNMSSHIQLSSTGWLRISELASKTNKAASQGFIAIWFDPDGSMNESISAIQAAIEQTGFKSMCIRDEHFSDRIMDKALGEIRKSRFVVVDLTASRPSVFFEAGFAFGLGIEAIYVYKSGTEKINPSLEFYVKHYQCHPYADATQLRDIVRDAISARIST